MTESTVETIGRALADSLCRDDACAVLCTQLVRPRCSPWRTPSP